MRQNQVAGLIGVRGGEEIGGKPTSLLKPMLRDIASDMQGMKEDPANISVKTAVSLYFGPVHGFDCSRNRAISAKYGISIVSPFYDRELYNVGLSVPWYMKTPSGELSKPLLRRIAIRKRLLPPDVALLKKMGLGSSRQSLSDTQMKIWATNGLSGWIVDTIEEYYDLVRHLINRDQLMKIVDSKRVYQVFQILQFILWYKRYFGCRRIERLPVKNPSSP
jgi:asparagine synthetase B (glutamine-hydrolysing)